MKYQTIHGFKLLQIDEAQWQLEKNYQGVEVNIFAEEKLIKIFDEAVFIQSRNVAQLPGLAGPVCIMPDAHSGYGAAIGTVFAMDEEDGYVSPGAVGYDINCGMRLLTTNLSIKEITPYIETLVNNFFNAVPVGVGGRGFLRVNKQELKRLTEEGVPYLVKQKGIGWQEDIENIEEKGKISGANLDAVSEKAVKRGIDQLATLGSGNHYLEIQQVETIFDKSKAQQWGILEKGQVTIMIHCGSRGFGHQICSDYLKIFEKHARKFVDRQLVALPIKTSEAQNYLAAMAAAANYAFVNREAITHQVRKVMEKVLGKKAEKLGLRLVYDVAHNIAKFENHQLPKTKTKATVLVHRKGATRSFPGKPVIIGGSMESGSYLLIGTETALTKSYGSTAHGSGRTMSRAQAKKRVHGHQLWHEMKKRGIYIKAATITGLAEEAGLAYKNINDVVKSITSAGLSKPVAYLKPVGNIKG